MGYGHGVVIRHNFKREKGVKKVFSNDMLAHVWAQQEQAEGQNHKGTASFEGEFFFSYYTAIARIYALESGARVLLLRDEKFSVTTSQHMPSPRVFAGPCFRVPYIGHSGGQTREPSYSSFDWKQANARVFVDRWQAAVAAERKVSAVHWQETLERRVSGYYWSGDSNDPAERPRDVAEAAQRYESQFVAGLMAYRTQCLAYCDALGVAYPLEFANESQARELAETQAREIVARFRRILDDPKNAARREAAKAKRAAKAGAYAESMFAKRAAWLAAPDAELIASEPLRHYGNIPRAPSVPYWKHTGGLTKAQTREAESLLRARETETGQGQAIREKEARLEHAALAAQRERDAAQFARWQAGESVSCPSSYMRDARGSARMRRVERDGRDMIQTSQGAEVLFSDAVRLFRFAKLIRERCYFAEMSESDIKAEAWRANGAQLRVTHFRLEAVHVDGSCRVGCHFLSWERIAEAAKACGVFDLPAADTTERRETGAA